MDHEIKKFILETLECLDNYEVYPCKTLVTELLGKFPSLKGRRYAANRLNAVLRQDPVKELYTKFKGTTCGFTGPNSARLRTYKQSYIKRNQLRLEERADGNDKEIMGATPGTPVGPDQSTGLVP